MQADASKASPSENHAPTQVRSPKRLELTEIATALQ
jgi:hypothetical protein